MTKKLLEVQPTRRPERPESSGPVGAAVRPVQTREDCIAASALLADVWGTTPEASPMAADLLTCFVSAGACVLGIFGQADELLGVTVAIAGPPQTDRLYSLIAAVSGRHAGLGLGATLKRAQRDWALERGASRIIWTYDPLIRRNAFFNLNRLGAQGTEYVKDFYPPINDAVNKGDLTDRLVVEWDLATEEPRAVDQAQSGIPILESDAGGGPVVNTIPTFGALLAWIPPDIESMRHTDPEMAMRWRLGAREALTSAFHAGYRPRYLRNDGNYVLTRESA